MSGPLHGITVIEVAGIGPGPFACMMLADMGAEVIRVDRVPGMGTGPLDSLMRNDGVVDRGRSSIAVNMKDPRGIELMLRLVERADALVEGFRPGVMEKLGLGPDVCHARNGRLVYGRMTGWGQHGPLAHGAGHDLNYIALSGALYAMGPADRPPTPPLNLVGDYGGGGMLMALGVVAALFEAGRSGLGQVVDVAMTDGAAVLMAAAYGLRAKGHWSDTRGANFLDGGAHFYGTYECADGKFVSLAAIEPQFYRLLLDKCGIADADFERQWDTAQWPTLRRKLEDLIRTRPRNEWCHLLEGSDACFAPVLDMAEAPRHPHNVARKTFVESGGVEQPAPAPRFERTASELPAPAPSIGRDTASVLARLGVGEREAAGLLAAGVVYAPRPCS